MIKVNVLYPNSEGATFDMDYYVSKHIPMVLGYLGDACKGVAVDAGLSGGQPGSEPTYVAVGSLLFDSVEVFQAAFGPHAGVIMADLPNFTNCEAVVQISDVKI